jgi:hypothetical protein
MHPILAYLRAVIRHSVALITSSLPIAAYTALTITRPDTSSTKYFWNHIPQPIVWLFVLLALTVAQFLAWKDAWLRSGTPEQPHLPKGFRLKQSMSHAQGQEAPERTKFELAVSEDLRGRAIRVTCNGPIYAKDFVPQYGVRRKKYKVLRGSYGMWEDDRNVIYKPGAIIKLTEEQAQSKSFKGRVALAQDTSIPDGEPWLASGEHAQKEDIRNDNMIDAVIFDFSSERLAARPFMVISGEVGSITPISITRVEWVETTSRLISLPHGRVSWPWKVRRRSKRTTTTDTTR